MAEGDSPPPRPIRPPNYVVTEFTDQSGKPKMPPRPNDSPMASQSVKRGPPPVPSYRSHLASRSSSDMSQPPDSESGSSSESGKVPSQDSSLPVAPPRKSQPSEEKPETEDATLHDPDPSKPATETPSRPSAPSRPHPPKPYTPPNKSTTLSKSTKEQSPPTNRSATMKASPASNSQEESKGFAGFFRKKSSKKPKPVITVVDAKPLSTEGVVSPSTATPSPNTPTVSDKQPEKSVETPVKQASTKPERPVSRPARPAPVKPSPFSSAKKDPEPDKKEEASCPSPQPRARTRSKKQEDSEGSEPVLAEETPKPVAAVRRQLSKDPHADTPPGTPTSSQSTEPDETHIYAVPRKPRKKISSQTEPSSSPADLGDESKAPAQPVVSTGDVPDVTQRPVRSPPPSEETAKMQKPNRPTAPRPRAATMGQKPRPQTHSQPHPQPVAKPRTPVPQAAMAIKEDTTEKVEETTATPPTKSDVSKEEEDSAKREEEKKNTSKKEDSIVTSPSRPGQPPSPRSRAATVGVRPRPPRPTPVKRDVPQISEKPRRKSTPEPAQVSTDSEKKKNAPTPKSKPPPPHHIQDKSKAAAKEEGKLPKESMDTEVQAPEQTSTPVQPAAAKRPTTVKRPPKPVPPSPRKKIPVEETQAVPTGAEEQKEAVNPESNKEETSPVLSKEYEAPAKADSEEPSEVNQGKEEDREKREVESTQESSGDKELSTSLPPKTEEDILKPREEEDQQRKVLPAKPKPPPSQDGAKSPASPGIKDSQKSKESKAAVDVGKEVDNVKESSVSDGVLAPKPPPSRRPPAVKRPSAPPTKPKPPQKQVQVEQKEENRESEKEKEEPAVTETKDTVGEDSSKVETEKKATEPVVAKEETQPRQSRPAKPRPPPPARQKSLALTKAGVMASLVKSDVQSNTAEQDKDTTSLEKTNSQPVEVSPPATPTTPQSSNSNNNTNIEDSKENKVAAPKKPTPKPGRPPARPKSAEKPVSSNTHEAEKKENEEGDLKAEEISNKEESKPDTKEVPEGDGCESVHNAEKADSKPSTEQSVVSPMVSAPSKEEKTKTPKRPPPKPGKPPARPKPAEKQPPPSPHGPAVDGGLDRAELVKKDETKSEEITVPKEEDERKQQVKTDSKPDPSTVPPPTAVDGSEGKDVVTKPSKKPPAKPGRPPGRPKPPEKIVLEDEKKEATVTGGHEGMESATKEEPGVSGQEDPKKNKDGQVSEPTKDDVPVEQNIIPQEEPNLKESSPLPSDGSPPEEPPNEELSQESTEVSPQVSDPVEPLQQTTPNPQSVEQSAEVLPGAEVGDVITTPTGSSSSQAGKPPKPPPPGKRPPPPDRKPKPPNPPPPKKPGPPRKGPPPQKPVKHTPVNPNAPPPLPSRPTLGHPFYHYVTTEPRAVGKYNYTGQTPGELSFDEGDVLELISREGLHWFLARNVNDSVYLPEGLVNETHIRIVKKLPEDVQKSTSEDKPCAIAMYDFHAMSPDELSLKNGDLVYLDARVDKEWLRGHTQSGKSGIFPVSVVEIVEDLPPGPMECELQVKEKQVEETTSISGPSCRAQFDFFSEAPGELSLNTGDVIELLERVDAQWLKGRLRGKEGIFPADFVTILEDVPIRSPEPPKPKPQKSSGNTVTAMFDFDGLEGELTFKTGAKIVVTAKVTDEWLEGTCGVQKGRFPSDFVDRVPDNLPTAVAQQPKSPQPQTQPKKTGKCKVLFKFETDIDGELPLNEGDIVETLLWISDEWMTGRLRNKEGIFPVSFVEVIEPLPRTVAETTKSHHVETDNDLMPKGLVLYDHNPRSHEEIGLKAGDIVLLLERASENRFNGENVQGEIGYFPEEIIDVIVPLP